MTARVGLLALLAIGAIVLVGLLVIALALPGRRRRGD